MMAKQAWASKIAVISLIASIIASGALPLPGAPAASAADAASAGEAEIRIDTFDPLPISSGLSGLNLEVANSEVWRYDDPRLIALLKETKVGWLRYFGGTSNNYYDWKMEAITEPMYAQHSERNLDVSYGGMQSIAGIGGLGFPQFVQLAREVGAKIIVTVNTMTDRPEHIRDLAKYASDNNIRVEYWQLGNEPWAYLPDDDPAVYMDATDYLNRVKPYHDAIKSVDPDALTSVFTTVFNDAKNRKWIEDMRQYPDKYWDSVTFHDYSGGQGETGEAARISVNKTLSEMEAKIKARAVEPNWSGIPVISTEWNTSLRNGAPNSQRYSMYGGIYAAEFIARMSASREINMQYLGYYNGIFNVVGYAKTYRYDAINAYEQGTVLNTSTDPSVDYKPYLTVPGLAIQLVNEALNRSSAAWRTTVSGSTYVPTGEQEVIPAIHAQAYKGNNGKNYLLITNKSDVPQQVTVKMDGTALPASANLSVRTLHSEAYGKSNNGGAGDLAIEERTSANPLLVEPYSVTRVEWGGESVPPAVPMLPGSGGTMTGPGSVTLRWTGSDNSDGYRVGYSTVSGNVYAWEDAGPAKAYTVTGLEPDRTYYFVVEAYNGFGSSSPSREIVLSTAVPEKPVAQSAYGLDGGLRVKWQGSKGAAGYKLHIGTAGGAYGTVIDVADRLGYDVSGLNNGTNYIVAVSAYNAYGESQLSMELEGVPRARLPLAPHNLKATQEPTSAVLDWIPSWTRKVYETFEDGAGCWTPAAGAWELYGENGFAVPTAACRNVSPAGVSMAVYDGYSGNDMEIKLWYKVDAWTGRAGVAVRYTDNDNYYAMMYDHDAKAVRVTKTVYGQTTELASYPANPRSAGKYYVIGFKASGSVLSGVWENSVKGFELTDTALTGGKVALITQNQLAYFDKADIYTPTPGETYRLLRSEAPTDGYEPVADGIAGNSYTDTGLSSAKDYYYRVEANGPGGAKSQDESIPATRRGASAGAGGSYLVFNPGFESPRLSGTAPSGATGAWTANQATLSITSEQAHSGQYSLKVTRNDPKGRPQFQSVGLKPNAEYAFSVWVKRSSGTHSGKIFIYQIGKQINGVSYPTVARNSSVGTDWTEVYGTFRMPSAPAYDKAMVAFQFESTGTDPDDQSVYFIDDFDVWELAE
ncbi:MAG: hypothetical protein K0Q94_5762 [Paenibacillus sp.]|nr:hypothetical protein [Paenibacillus sp.]